MGTYLVTLKRLDKNGNIIYKDSRLGFSLKSEAERFGKGMVRDYPERVKGYTVNFDASL